MSKSYSKRVKRIERDARRVLAKRKERAILKERYREFDRLSLIDEDYAMSKAIPEEGAEQVASREAKIDALGILHLRIGYSDGSAEWVEEWSYNGKFTIQWARE